MIMIGLLMQAGVVSSAARAGTPPFDAGSRGFGLLFGEPWGITGKLRLMNARAVDAGIAASPYRYAFLYSDYLFRLIEHRGTELSIGVGGGFLITGPSGFRGATRSFLICARIPIGVEYAVPDSSVGVFLEAVPALALLPDFFDFMQGGIGVRFYL